MKVTSAELEVVLIRDNKRQLNGCYDYWSMILFHLYLVAHADVLNKIRIKIRQKLNDSYRSIPMLWYVYQREKEIFTFQDVVFFLRRDFSILWRHVMAIYIRKCVSGRSTIYFRKHHTLRSWRRLHSHFLKKTWLITISLVKNNSVWITTASVNIDIKIRIGQINSDQIGNCIRNSLFWWMKCSSSTSWYFSLPTMTLVLLLHYY